MQNDLPEDGIRAMWLNQPTEIPQMTSIWIEQRSRELRTKTRRKLIGNVAGPLAVGVFYACGITGQRQSLQLPFALALAWSLAGLYFLNRGMWSAVIPGDSGLSAGLESCRREIERQRDLVRRVLLWSLCPIMLAIGTLVAALAMVSTGERGLVPNGLPFLFLAAAWIVAVFVIRFREQRELQRQLEELKDIELKNRNQVPW
jgi:amino acid transporter